MLITASHVLRSTMKTVSAPASLRSSGNRACLRHSHKVHATRMAHVERERAQSYDGYLSAMSR